MPGLRSSFALCALFVSILLATPPAGAAFLGWATEVASYEPGPDDLTDPTDPGIAFNVPELGLGPVDGRIVALGEGGSIAVGFAEPLPWRNGEDFVVYENSFFVPEEYGGPGVFAELAFVEVSSDGISFARFPTLSLQPGPPLDFYISDPSLLTGFAGVSPGGDPFDLADLTGASEVLAGLVDLHQIRYVRFVDIVGDGATADDAGNPIFDPWPTGGFGSSGFDLDAVGAVPEPFSGSLLALGVLGLAGLRRLG